MTLEELQKEVIKFRDERDWKQFHNPKDVAISLTLEASELLEHFQWRNEKEVSRHLKANKQQVEDELADILYWILLMSHDLKINLPDALSRKLQINNKKYPVNKSKGTHKKYTEL